jgi:predicted phage gp36 major capsid-like protein
MIRSIFNVGQKAAVFTRLKQLMTDEEKAEFDIKFGTRLKAIKIEQAEELKQQEEKWSEDSKERDDINRIKEDVMTLKHQEFEEKTNKCIAQIDNLFNETIDADNRSVEELIKFCTTLNELYCYFGFSDLSSNLTENLASSITSFKNKIQELDVDINDYRQHLTQHFLKLISKEYLSTNFRLSLMAGILLTGEVS